MYGKCTYHSKSFNLWIHHDAYLFISFPEMSRTQRENIFAQAMFTKEIWTLASKVMDMFEEGTLKDQHVKKGLISTPQVMQHHLQPICRLPTTVQKSLLEEVIQEELSLKEMKDKADYHRWAVTFPNFTTSERLQQFVLRMKYPKSSKLFVKLPLTLVNVLYCTLS